LRKARNETGADRIARPRKHDRDDRCCLFRRKDRHGSQRDNEIDLEPDEFGRDLGETLVAALRPAILDCEVVTLDPTELAQPLHKRGDPLALNQRRGRAQKPDGRLLARLLRARRERPRSRAAERG